MWKWIALVAAITTVHGVANAEPNRGAAEKRPAIGFVIVAWDEATKSNPRAWERSLEQLSAAGVRDVTLVTYRFIDRKTIKISSASAFGLDSPPSNSVLRATLRKAKRLGMRVSLNPLLEIDNEDDLGGVWRGELSYSAAELKTFFANYGEYILSMARLVAAEDGYRLYVGSELKSLSANRNALPHWKNLIRQTRLVASPQVKLSYAANYDNANRIPF
ncbi:MAG: hypothetical protein QF805_27950, partial [Pirellulaceae bacterium]|nr:hypothetical protein [Pirellulaceae bacterium]